ncbi:PA0069 family radical SAM protein [Cognatitamlana onchidii]|uniref:PA0069 family radical SAM protein n=1 Tax=Cognatitamlana onchidii TaxID=2562860 RepID=UPI0010A5C63B|nr:PA0069 family radical SAM protein [Algibacter onchidii]
MNPKTYLKGRGAQSQVSNKFLKYNEVLRDDFLEYCLKEGELPADNKTHFQEVFPKTIVNKVTSPDVGMNYSMNPYQGCEHGCVYCYARNTHEYWGYGAGLDFERQILVKKNAHKLLEAHLKKKCWEAKTIVMSGNTDCYQPAEKKYKITRQCLKVFLKYKHPVGIITKNALILRDLDILKALANNNLLAIHISITSLSEETRWVLEPRTTSIKMRLNTIKVLSSHGIPVNVMLAPIIPAINSHEILNLAKAVSEHGATSISHTIVRLNGAIGEVFREWIYKVMPDRAEKVLHQIEGCHAGRLSDSRYGQRMRGDGKIAEQIHDLVSLAKRLYFKEARMPELNLELFSAYKHGQLKLF